MEEKTISEKCKECNYYDYLCYGTETSCDKYTERRVQSETIKNGVDVAKCRHFDMHDITTCKLETKIKGFSTKCSSCSNCDYKRAERLEKENEILKQYKSSKQASYEFTQQELLKTAHKNKELECTLTIIEFRKEEEKAHRIELERQLEAEKQKVKELEYELRQKQMTILKNNDHYYNVDQANRKYKQTLIEINKLAQKQIEEDINNLNSNGSSTKLANLILQQCEVVND